MPSPSFGMVPPFRDFGDKPGDATSAGWIKRTNAELNAARNFSVSPPLSLRPAPDGIHLALEKGTMQLRRFQYLGDLASGSYANAQLIGFISSDTTSLQTVLGEQFVVWDAVLGRPASITVAKTGDYGLAYFAEDQTRWEVLQPSALSASTDDFFLAQITCRAKVGSYFYYSWIEMQLGGATDPISIKLNGRSGYPASSINVAKVVTGDATVYAEIEFISFCGPTPTSGTWTINGGSGLAYNADAAAVQSSLQSTTGDSGLLVTGDMSAGFYVYWSTPAVVTTLVGVSSLLPTGIDSWPAREINDRKVIVGTNVWMRRYFRPALPAVISVTKTASGNNAGVHAAFSIYMDQVTNGTFTITWDGILTPPIAYNITGAALKTYIESLIPSIGLSSFSGSGTIGSPWTFSVITDAADHTLTADGTLLRDKSAYLFQSDWPSECALEQNIVTRAEWVDEIVEGEHICTFTKQDKTLAEILGC